MDKFPLSARFANAIESCLAYFGKMIWPTHLAVFYPFPRSFSVPLMMLELLVVVAITVAVIQLRQDRPYLAVGWFWYVGTLIPVIGIVQVGLQARADRYTYIPLIGLFIVIAWGFPDQLGRLPLMKRTLPLAVSALLLTFAISARTQTESWKDSSSLWTHALEVTDDNYVAHNSIGSILVTQGKLNEAASQFYQALRIAPDYEEAHYNLGITSAQLGNFNESLTHLYEAVRLKPDHAEAHNNLGYVLIRERRFDDAIAQFSEAVRIRPDYTTAQDNLKMALQQRARR